LGGGALLAAGRAFSKVGRGYGHGVTREDHGIETVVFHAEEAPTLLHIMNGQPILVSRSLGRSDKFPRPGCDDESSLV
jgi:hypothetical protein